MADPVFKIYRTLPLSAKASLKIVEVNDIVHESHHILPPRFAALWVKEDDESVREVPGGK